MAASKTAFYAPQLDGLRFLAALVVFIHHAPVLPGPVLGALHTHGWVGVDLFLCISAYLLTTLLRIEHQTTGAVHVGEFLIRRALRIWPLYFVFATAMCARSAFRAEAPWDTILGWWLSHLSFTANVATALRGYSPIANTAHLWTISLEEQVYLVLPFVLSWVFAANVDARALRRALFAVVCVLVLGRTAIYLLHAPHPFVWVLPLRADSFLLGVGIALWFPSHTTAASSVRRPWLWALAGLLVIASVVFFPAIAQRTYFQILVYLVTALGCAFIVHGAQAGTLRDSFLAARPMRYLGKISYGLYVFHLLGLSLGAKLTRGHGGAVGTTVVGFAVTVALSALSYTLLEKPFIRAKARFTRIESRPI